MLPVHVHINTFNKMQIKTTGRVVYTIVVYNSSLYNSSTVVYTFFIQWAKIK